MTDVSGALVPLEQGPGAFPAPTTLKLALLARLGENVDRIRTERGQVTGPEDTFALIRMLTEADEHMAEYGHAFGEVKKAIVGYVEDEAVDAVGEQEGIPLANLTVPAAGGDIRVSRKITNSYTIDMTQVVPALVAAAIEEWSGPGGLDGESFTYDMVAEFAIEVALVALSFYGKKAPNVSEVRALAAQLSRAGKDQLAKVATDAITKHENYRGISVDRKRVS